MNSCKTRCDGSWKHRGAAIGLFFIGVLPVFAQSSASSNPGHPTKATQSAAGEDEFSAVLRKRLTDLQAAKSSGDPERVKHASELVTALALRQLGQIRFLESAYGQAIELYKHSLEFEGLPETRIDLALAEMQKGELDSAVEEANKALQDAPNDVRAYQILGNIWVTKKKYSEAIHALEQAARLSPTIENLYSLAIAQLASKDPAQRVAAEKTFTEIKKLAGDSGSLHVIFGRAYRDAGDLPAAIHEFEIAIKIDPRTPHAHYFLGLAHLAANEWAPTPEVLAEFAKELEIYPKDYLANYMSGFVLSAERNYEGAAKYLRAAAAINPTAPDPWLYLGLGAFAGGDMNEAERYFRKAIELTGEDYARGNYQIRRAYIDLARILVTSGREGEAKPYVDKAHELQNRILHTSQQGMASHFMEEGANSAAAVVMPPPEETQAELGGKEKRTADIFATVDAPVMERSNLTEEQREQAAAREQQLRAILADSYTDLGTSEALRKNYRSALQYYQQAEKWDAGSPGLARNIGVAAFRVHDYSEAIRGLSASLSANPGDRAVRAMLGMAYYAQDQFKEAAATFEPLGEKGMKDSAVGYAWAASLTKMGELPRATEVLQTFASEDRPNDVLMLVGQLWIEIQDYSRAESTFERILKADPQMTKAHYFAGQAYLRSEHWDEAAREFQAELALHPSDVDAKFNLGFVYLQLSRSADAEKLFQEVIEAQPEQANAQYEYGKILMDHGDVHGAIAHLEVAARLKPNTDYVHYQLQAAYRKDGRTADADRELEIYKQIKAKKRERASEAISEKQNP